MKLSITREGVSFELAPKDPAYRDVNRWTRLRMFAWPDNLYRMVARRKIAALIAENRRLRRAGYGGKDPRPLVRAFEWAFLTWLDRRHPLPPE